MSDHLRSFVERIERIEADIAELNADKSDVYKEAKSSGFDVKVLRKLIAIRRQPAHEREETDAVLATYMVALGMVPDQPLVRAPAYVHAREASETLSQGGPFLSSAHGGTDDNQGETAPVTGRQTEGASPVALQRRPVIESSEVLQAATPIPRDEYPEMPAFLRRTRPVASEITA